ncbi:MAG: hypothetical protein R3Y16_06605 [Rikenellaceae bacterium]
MDKSKLKGTWLFIGAEKFEYPEWTPSNYTRGMSWRFGPQFFSLKKTIGSIEASSPNGPTEYLSYTFDSESSLLRVVVGDSASDGVIKDSQVDIYEVTSASDDTIYISIQNQAGRPAPYFRYLLRKME